jgi:hypothetical protein
LGVSATGQECHHVFPSATQRFGVHDFSSAFEPNYLRHAWQGRVLALSLETVGPVDSGSFDFYQHLIFVGQLRDWVFFYLKDC